MRGDELAQSRLKIEQRCSKVLAFGAGGTHLGVSEIKWLGALDSNGLTLQHQEKKKLPHGMRARPKCRSDSGKEKGLSRGEMR